MIPKPKKIVSKKIRTSAENEPCTLRIMGVCNRDPKTTVFAHLNSASKGVSTKSNDLHGVFACSSCHSHLNANKVNSADQLRALIETQTKLIQKGLIEVK